MSTIRYLIAVVASKRWSLYQLDVNNAFVHGDLKEEVYMQVPQGYGNIRDKVCKLKKSLYGLKQASRQWFAKLVNELISQDYQQSKSDHSLFTKREKDNLTILAIYVDDIILTGNSDTEIKNIKAHIDTAFSIKDLGKLHFFLGIDLNYLDGGIVLSQNKFIKSLLKEHYQDKTTRQTLTPLPIHLKLLALEGTLMDDPTPYRSIVGKLKYLTNTRPDLAYDVQTLSQFMQKPRDFHWKALHHTLSYVERTCGQGILLKATNKITVQAFSNSDWGSCIDSRRSITRYLIMLGQSPVSWKSKKQGTVSRSSSKAEYRAMASIAAEITWIVRLLEELNLEKLRPITLHCDN